MNNPSGPQSSNNPSSLSKNPHAASSYLSLPHWNDWQWHVRNQITSVQDLDQWISLSVEEKRAVQFSSGRFHFALTPYWVSLIDSDDFFCPIRRQSIPLDEEFRTHQVEASDFKVQGMKAANGRLTHAYSDRALISVHSACAVYCRFCPQRKMSPVQDGSEPQFLTITDQELAEARLYLEKHPLIREVTVSGGEPLLLNDEAIRKILSVLKSVPSVRTVRLETRVLSVLPQRITPALVSILKEHQPLYLMIHVNHPREITEEFADACALLAGAGVPLASETVLMREINDKSPLLAGLFYQLYQMRVRPFRLVQCIPSSGTDHFRTSVSAGLRISDTLRGNLPGLALPEYVVETAGGKIPLRMESVLSRNKKRVLLKNHEGKVFVYPEKVFSFSS